MCLHDPARLGPTRPAHRSGLEGGEALAELVVVEGAAAVGVHQREEVRDLGRHMESDADTPNQLYDYNQLHNGRAELRDLGRHANYKADCMMSRTTTIPCATSASSPAILPGTQSARQVPGKQSQPCEIARTRAKSPRTRVKSTVVRNRANSRELAANSRKIDGRAKSCEFARTRRELA